MVSQALRQIVLTTLLLFCPVWAWSGALDRGPMQQRYNPSAESMIRVPGVIGLDEMQAMSSLQQAGLTVRIEYEAQEKEALAGKEFTVIDQEPGTAGVAMLGSTVTITVYKPPGAAQPDPYGQPGGYYDNGYGGYPQDGYGQPGGYYDDGYGQPGGSYDDGYGQPAPGGYDAYGNPLPAEQAPVSWGGGGQPSAEQPSTRPGAPALGPSLDNDVPSVAPPAPHPPGVAPLSPAGRAQPQEADEPKVPVVTLPAADRIPDIRRPVEEVQVPSASAPKVPESQGLEPRSGRSSDTQGLVPRTRTAPVRGADKGSAPVIRPVNPLGTQSKTGRDHKRSGIVAGKVPSLTPGSVQPQEQTGQVAKRPAFKVALSAPDISGHSSWRVGSWQTDSWETFYEGKDQPLDTWKNFQNHIRRAYKKIIDNPKVPGTIVVDTPQGKVACTSASIQNALKSIRVGLFFSCLAGMQNTNLMNVVRGAETHMKRLLAMLKRLNDEMLPEKGRSRDGTITSATHKKFISYFSKDDQINITITKTGGKSRATVVGYIGDISDVWRPWNCEFAKGKNNIGDTCSFAFQEANNRFIGVRIDGYSAVNSFKYRISVN